jgi:hypothetical protein
MMKKPTDNALMPIRSFCDYAHVVPVTQEDGTSALCVNPDAGADVLLSAAHGRVERVRDLLKPFNGRSDLADIVPSDVLTDFLYALAGIADEAEQILDHAVGVAIKANRGAK